MWIPFTNWCRFFSALRTSLLYWIRQVTTNKFYQRISLFSLHFWNIVFVGYRILTNTFFSAVWQYHYIVFSCPFFWQVFSINHVVVSLHISHFPWVSNILSLFMSFNCLILMCPGGDLFIFIPLRIHWAFLVQEINVSSFYFFKYSFVLLPLSTPFSDFHYVYVGLLNDVPQILRL